MNFSPETIKEAIAQAYDLNILRGDNQDAVAALIISNCAQIEGEKIRADYEARHESGDRPEWSTATA